VYLPYLLEGLAVLATALIILVFQPRAPGARAGVALGSVAGLMQILALDLFAAGWVQRAYFVVESMVPAVLVHFALCFPDRKGPLRRHPSLAWLPYAACLPLAFLQNLHVASDPARHLAVNDFVYTTAALCGLGAMASLVYSLRSARTARARQQVKVVLAGIVAAVVIPALGLLALIEFGVRVPMNALTPFFLLFPASIAYAVARHDLFNVDRYLRLGVVWGALTIVVFASYAAVALLGQAWLDTWDRASHVLAPLYVLLMLLVANPLRARIQATVDRLFYRQGYDYRHTVDATSRVLASVLDTDRIATTVLETLTHIMTAEWAALLVFAEGPGPHRVFARPDAKGTAIRRVASTDTPQLSRLSSLSDPWIRYGARRPASPLRDLFATLDAALALPLRFEGRLVGVLFAGDKLGAAYYGEEDLDLLRTLANQSAVALVNARAAEIIRRTQTELAQAERLAAVGELASAVAHGIRNPLAGIRTSAEVARDGLATSDEDLRESLDDIIGETDRLETRIRTILEFTRPTELEVTAADLGRFVGMLADELRRRLPEGIDLRVESAADLPPVDFNHTALGEVIETIAVNAVEAMQREGCIRLRSGIAAFDGRGDHAFVEVADSGPGMDEATRRRVFDLFYTTKQTGTGVGLAMARRLVERQGGSITLDTAPGAGATFRVWLPIAPRINAGTS